MENNFFFYVFKIILKAAFLQLIPNLWLSCLCQDQLVFTYQLPDFMKKQN